MHAGVYLRLNTTVHTIVDQRPVSRSIVIHIGDSISYLSIKAVHIKQPVSSAPHMFAPRRRLGRSHSKELLIADVLCHLEATANNNRGPNIPPCTP